jgi:hypothetical protein
VINTTHYSLLSALVRQIGRDLPRQQIDLHDSHFSIMPVGLEVDMRVFFDIFKCVQLLTKSPEQDQGHAESALTVRVRVGFL